MSLEKIQERIREFANERNWEQFHTPKNLAMAIGSESGELLEIFQWMNEKASMFPDYKDVGSNKGITLRHHDIFPQNMRFSQNRSNRIYEQKIDKNTEKYPVEKSYVNTVKYNRR